MISVVLISMFALLLLGGVFMLLGSMAKFASYASTKGSIVKWLSCSPCLDQGLEVEAADATIPLAAVISYKVNGETFELTAAVNKELLKVRKKRINEVQVFYNPYDPKKARLREGGPFMGLSLIIISASAIILLLVL
jgi:hypothetical protein